MGPALFRRRPHLRDTPFLSLGDFPTAVERIDGLLPPRVELWVKREDRAAAAYGGNKVRKLEFLLAEARARGKKRVVTIGGWGSHHALATAIYARQVGLGCELMLFPQPMTEHVREQLAADRAAGAIVHEARHLVRMVPALLASRFASDTYYIAGGGSSVTGTLGWVSAADELGEQIEHGELPRPDAIYVALGSSGTVAGLLAGLRGAAYAPDELVAVRVVERPIAGYGPARKLEDATLARIGGAALAPIPLRVVHDQIGRGYGHATDVALEAWTAAARVGLVLEPTYTGKALAGLLADAHSGLLDGKRVLFINTYAGR
jgi:D-cysteine desulfhydrase